jgi:hypothetical protein
MIELKELLLKSKNLLTKEGIKRELVRGLVSEVINFEIKKEEIEIKKNNIFLRLKPVYKNEVLLNQEKILLKIKETIGKDFLLKFK